MSGLAHNNLGMSLFYVMTFQTNIFVYFYRCARSAPFHTTHHVITHKNTSHYLQEISPPSQSPQWYGPHGRLKNLTKRNEFICSQLLLLVIFVRIFSFYEIFFIRENLFFFIKTLFESFLSMKISSFYENLFESLLIYDYL